MDTKSKQKERSFEFVLDKLKAAEVIDQEWEDHLDQQYIGCSKDEFDELKAAEVIDQEWEDHLDQQYIGCSKDEFDELKELLMI